MASTYADGLSQYMNKGKCGLPEKFDSMDIVKEKVKLLADWFKRSQHIIFHTGAGISTAAGIPDFRGPNGIWTLEAKGKKPDSDLSFENAFPTVTHMALVALQEKGFLKYLISQNIDGLHLRSGFPRGLLSELHGNVYVAQCSRCKNAISSVGQKFIGLGCPMLKDNGRNCRGKLKDTILDWESHLPYADLIMSESHSSIADLHICLGTTLQIVPSGNLPLSTKRNGGRIVICNLQPTKHDRKADLIINAYVDEMMILLLQELDISISPYDPTTDLIKILSNQNDYDKHFALSVWSIKDETLKNRPRIKTTKRKSEIKNSPQKLQKIEDY